MRWLAASVGLAALVFVGAYTHARSVYPTETRSGWGEQRRDIYALWRVDLAASTRSVLLLLGLVLALYAFRRFRLGVLVRRPGPIEVAELDNATGQTDLPVAELTTRFRIALSRVNLNSSGPVPGATRPSEFLELFRSASSEKNPLAVVAGLMGLASVSHAYRVNAVLRCREGEEPCGVTVSVAILPHGGTTPVELWARTWPHVIDKAATAVGAAILPLTTLCRRPPWYGWRGLELPAGLFSDYLEAKSLTAAHRYDEALGKYFDALAYDPLNLYLRLEVGQLQEQLRLFLDALETYDDLIVLGTRKDQRLRRPIVKWLEHRRAGEWRQLSPPGPREVGARGRAGLQPASGRLRSTNLQRVLLVARYRYALVLGFSEVLLAQWLKVAEARPAGGHLAIDPAHSTGPGGGPGGRTARDRERSRLRHRLLPRLVRYDRRSVGSPSVPIESAVLSAVTPDESHLPAERLDEIARELRAVTQSVRRKALRTLTEADRAEFSKRFTRAEALRIDSSPGVQELYAAGRSVLAAADGRLPDDLWAADRKKVDRVMAQVRLPDPFLPDTLQVLHGQELLQRAALAELSQLHQDYRWWTGRRRLHISVTTSALRLSCTWAELRLRRVQALISREQEEPEPSWPPSYEEVRTSVHRALRGNLTAGRQWQDHYNAACVYALALLPDNSWAGQGTGHRLAPPQVAVSGRHTVETDLARAAHAVVRSLERAIDASDSSFAASRREWVSSGDPDLVGFRSRPEFAQFRARNFPKADFAVPQPPNVHVLQLSAYVVLLLRAVARAEQQRWEHSLPGLVADPSRLALRLEQDVRSWADVRDVAVGHRDWRVRLDALRHIRETAIDEVTGAISYPRYPHPGIGDLRFVSDPGDARCLYVAARFGRQERVAQVGRLAILAQGHHAFLLAGGNDAAVTLRGDRLGRYLRQRARLWQLLEQSIALDFFTDDKAELDRRKQEADRRMKHLASALAGLQAKQELVLDLDRPARSELLPRVPPQVSPRSTRRRVR